MMPTSRTLGTCALFVAAFTGALAVTSRSWNGTVYVYVGERRAPASVRRARDYAPIERAALSRKPDAQLMSGAQVLQSGEEVGVGLGHPLLPRGAGREFACAVGGHPGIYDRVEVTFYGIGVTDNGERPQLVVETDCRAAEKIDALETLWIPAKALFAAKPGDRDFEVEGERRLNVSLQHIPDVWPESWVLWNVRFYRSDDATDSGLTIDAAHLRANAISLPSFRTVR